MVATATSASSTAVGDRHFSGCSGSTHFVFSGQHTSNIGNTGASAGGLLGIPINLLPQIGLDCDPLPVLGVAGNNCAAQPACCQETAFVRILLFIL